MTIFKKIAIYAASGILSLSSLNASAQDKPVADDSKLDKNSFNIVVDTVPIESYNLNEDYITDTTNMKLNKEVLLNVMEDLIKDGDSLLLENLKEIENLLLLEQVYVTKC